MLRRMCTVDTIRYDSVYLTCRKMLTGTESTEVCNYGKGLVNKKIK